ncbi:MAG TPA: serine/threonine-protein kinase, partial [Thermoanaerobaculia bacterium]|nr:serine/threonine-protein kinase [Thermoanaerobaculia bacterium]
MERIGPYEVLEKLGEGGMGVVYRARDSRLGRELAIKVLPSEWTADPDRLARFAQEARAASALNHPNIVTVYDVGRERETSYLALELVVGASLRELLGEPLPAKRALAIAAQIAEGVAAAHASGIVHRDLKPENIMVTREGLVKILDFGLAKLVAPLSDGASALATVSRATMEGTVLGTIGYMSPEQATGKPVDFRSDQFSFGAILYEMLSGRRAFHGASAPETLAAIIREEPEPIDSSVPAPLRWVVERCLAKDPEERYASTRDLAHDLAKLKEHTSEALSQASLAAAPERRSRARWILPAAAGAAALTLAVGLLLGTRLARRPTPRFTRLTFQRGRVIDAR